MKNIITIILIALLPLISFAQRGERLFENQEIRDKRTSYIALRLDLSMEQSILFKEQYDQYENNRKAIRSQFEEQQKTPNTETEADQFVQARFKMEEDLIAAKRTFYQNLKQHISSLKLIQLPKIEGEFKEILIQRLRKEQRRNRG